MCNTIENTHIWISLSVENVISTSLHAEKLPFSGSIEHGYKKKLQYK